ncbi:lipid droplet-regulating VLDL assembly factor AUP1 [Daphnia magna]|uniref:lipid droplet-regulating VLDL assembly factor AUP1 n=1 Tax=Daphnia magna TaxID=35525 RepID=UPI001E1BBF15|nr:lipid droplet-regulating VLDL assembly factor AUP1 [Daphnia magna]
MIRMGQYCLDLTSPNRSVFWLLFSCSHASVYVSSAMASPNLEELFEDSRIIQWDWTLLLLVFYTPLGILLLVMRIFALIQFYLMFLYMPYQPIKRYLLRVCGLMLGVFVNEKHSSKAAAQENAVWVANHCSPFDSIVLQVIAGAPRVTIFPEDETTTAKSGLLKFQPGKFDQHKRNNPKLPVQPLSLKVSRPFPPFAVTVLDSQPWTDAFFLLFSPCTIFNIKFLDPADCREDEELEAYVNRIESAISQDLGINATSFTAKDKIELIKRKRFEAHPPRPVQRSHNRWQVMANQVKEVLPHVPISVILSDLSRTNSVDATVANLVEGVVPFTPEPIVTRVENPPTGSAPSPGPSNYKPAGASSQVQQVSASTFSKLVHERGLSLQERKQRLLRQAQLRYCERHNLQIPGINC